MEFRTKKEIRDTTSKQGFSRITLKLDHACFTRMREISDSLETYASEITRVLIVETINTYEQKGEFNLKVRTKLDVKDTTTNQGLSVIKLNLNKDDFNQLRRIAEENNTYASEIIRQLMADFVANYEKEHENGCK